MFLKVDAIVYVLVLAAVLTFSFTYTILNSDPYKKWKSVRDNEADATTTSSPNEITWAENEKWLIQRLQSTPLESDESSEQLLYQKHIKKSHQFIKGLVDQGLRDWKEFKGKHSRIFTSLEKERQRMLSFINAERYINLHNEAFEDGSSTFQVGINDLADFLPSEYEQLNGYRSSDSLSTPAVTLDWILLSDTLLSEIPDSIDWREDGFVTNVKNQGSCGSCWAFATVGAVEGQHKRSTQSLISLSEQNLIDCSQKYDNYGCDGGHMTRAYEYIMNNHGIATEDSYPYKEAERKCHYSQSNVGAVITGYVQVSMDDEEALKYAVATKGPVAVAIDAGHKSFQYYKDGVYYEPKCSTRKLNHAVLVVGYGRDPKYGDYWLVKNSWGTSWGLNGYIKMARNQKNHCGIATSASYPII